MRLGRAALLCVALLGCGAAEEPRPSAPSGPPLHLAPATDLAQGAELFWLMDLAPRALAAHTDLLPSVDALLSSAQIASIASRYGGVDLLSLEELVIASYASPQGETMLYLVRGAVSPEKVEASFRARAETIGGRAVDRDTKTNAIVRLWGTVQGDRVQVATFGRQVAALEIGRFGPLRVAELFAQERLKRAEPALRIGPLPRVAELLRDPGPDDPPLRAFALGPFEGESAKALGGLLAASTAVGVSARPIEFKGHPALDCTIVLAGGWGAKASDAAEHLRAAFDALSATGLSRLAGLDRPLEPVRVDAVPDALRLRVVLDAVTLARGARAAMGAEISEIMSY